VRYAPRVAAVESVKDDRALAWENLLGARMNIIYYGRMIRWWRAVDQATKIAVALASSATLVLLLSKNAPVFAIVLTGVAAVLSVIASALAVPERVRALGVLLVEFVGHHRTFERLYYRANKGEDIGADLSAALDALAETERREAKDDAAPPRRALERAQRETLEAFGAPA